MHQYVIALGSNIRHHRHGVPRMVLRQALDTLARDMDVIAASNIISSRPVGPSRREYANAAALVASDLAPLTLLALLKEIERHFGRRRGQRWGARVLDLDIILWSGGRWQDKVLTIPHARFRDRAFVLGPAAAIAAHWRDPVSGKTLFQLFCYSARSR